MKRSFIRVVAHIHRSLLGLIFLLNGLNGFVHFRHELTFQTFVARQYMAVMQATPYGHVPFALQMLCGMLLLLRLPDRLDLVLLDGPKALYADILHLVETRLRPDSLVLVDDADRCPDFVSRMRGDTHGYLSVSLAGDLELSMRLS